MQKKTAKIEVLNEKISNKDMQNYANEVLSQKNKMKVMDISSFSSGDMCCDVFSKNTQIYINPTEALKVAQYVKEGDSVATVLSSGDFALDAVFAGARNVLTFDISKFQYPVALLKTQAMSVLDYDDYYSFFSDIYSKGYLSPEIYSLIVSKSKNPLLFSFWDIFMTERINEKHRLMKDTNYKFFTDAKALSEMGLLPSELSEMIYSLVGSDGQETIKLFNDIYYNKIMKDIDKSFKPLRTITALSGEGGEKTPGSYIESASSYETTRRRLDGINIKFFRTDIAKLKYNLIRSGYTKDGFNGFDTIYLSNIPEFFSGTSFVEIVNSQLMPLLSDDGSIIYCCQGVDEDVLRDESTRDYDKVRKELSSTEDILPLFNKIMEINDSETYHLLNSFYDLSLDVVDTYCEANGNGKSDIYVKVMKK